MRPTSTGGMADAQRDGRRTARIGSPHRADRPLTGTARMIDPSRRTCQGVRRMMGHTSPVLPAAACPHGAASGRGMFTERRCPRRRRTRTRTGSAAPAGDARQAPQWATQDGPGSGGSPAPLRSPRSAVAVRHTAGRPAHRTRSCAASTGPTVIVGASVRLPRRARRVRSRVGRDGAARGRGCQWSCDARSPDGAGTEHPVIQHEVDSRSRVSAASRSSSSTGSNTRCVGPSAHRCRSSKSTCPSRVRWIRSCATGGRNA